MNNDLRIDNAERVRSGFMDLSGTDKAKVVGLKVAKVAVVVLAAAALVAAVWFLAPVAIPAGIFTFGGSMAGLIGGGALLSTIEGLAFKKLNRIEAGICSKYSVLVINMRNEGLVEIVKERLNLDQIERDVKGLDGISYTQIERLTSSASNETRENIFFANSQSVLNMTLDYLQLNDPDKDNYDLLMDGLEPGEHAKFICDEAKRCTTVTTRYARADMVKDTKELFEVTITINWDTTEARIVRKELNITKPLTEQATQPPLVISTSSKTPAQ